MAELAQTILDARQRRALQYEQERALTPEVPVENPKVLDFTKELTGFEGVSITPFTEDKSLVRRAGEDTALLGQGLTIGLGQVAAGLTGFGTKEEDKFWSPEKSVETVKELGSATVQSFKDLGTKQYYKEHPLLAGADLILTAASIASFGTGFLVKAPIMAAIKTAMKVGVKQGIKEAIVESALRTGIKIGGKQITKGALGHAVEVGIAKNSFEVVRETALRLLSKKGVVGKSADVVADTLVKNLEKSLIKNQTRNKVLSRIGHPLAATTTGIKVGTGALRSTLFGADEASGVGIKFTSKVVGENPEAFVGMERWAGQQVVQEGLENTPKNRALKISEWEASNPTFNKLSPEQKAAHFANYSEATQAGKLLSASTDTAGVVVKAVDQNTVDAMVRTIKDAPDGEDLIKMLKENGFEKELRFNEEEIKISLVDDASLKKAATDGGWQKAYKKAVIAQVKNLSRTGTTISFRTLSSGESALLKDISDRGYRFGYAPKGKEIIFAEKVVGGVEKVAETATENLIVTRTLAQQRNRQFLNFIKNIGLSSEGVPVTLPMWQYAQNFGQHILGSFAEKYGGRIKLNLKGTSTKIYLPVDKIYDWLENNIDTVALLREKGLEKVLTGRGLKPRAIFDLTIEDFKNLGLSKEMAKDLETIARRSRREINASAIGAGEKIVNYLRTGSNPVSRAFNTFINHANLGRYTYSPFFIFQTFFETNINASLMLKNPLFLPGFGGVAKRGARVASAITQKLNNVGIAPERMVRWVENAKSYINDVIGKPTSREEILFHKTIARNFGTEFEQTSFTTASQMERYAVGGADELSKPRKLPGIRELKSFEADKQRKNILAATIGASMQKTSTQFGKGIAKRFGMTLEEALDYDFVNGKQVFKNPEVVKLMREQLQTLLHYKEGMLTSPLIKTLNVVFFPMRFQMKAMDIAAKWYGSLSPASRIIVANNWIHFAQWAGTDEGKEWRRTNKNTFFRVLEYSTAYAQVGDAIDAVTRGNLFGGNAGLIGGVPFGFIVEIARNLGYFPDDPEQYNPKTGERFEKEVAVQGATLAQVTQSIEEIVGQMMPGTPIYTLSGGLLSGSARSFVQRSLIRPLAGIGRQIWTGEDITEGKKEIERDFEYVSLDE